MMTAYIKSLSQDDRGVSAILIAICMVVLLGFAAIVIDATGLGFNERRQDQSAADVGALAAVQFAVPTDLGNGCTGSAFARSVCNGAHEAIEVANATLDDPTLADWSNGSLCGTPPAGFSTVASVSNCIAFNSNAQRAWVRIPTISRATFIAGAIGFDSISTSADAIAGATVNPPGGVLPFLLPGSAAATNYNCLKAGANPKFGPCDDAPVIGNFGSADFFLYGDADKLWTAKCSGDTNGRLVANIARGVDHPLSTHPTGVGAGVEESPNCPVFSAQPNMVDSQTGIGSNLEDGLLYGASSYASSSYPGKIQKGTGYTVRSSGGSKAAAIVDNDPLWSYLKPTNTGSCSPSVAVDPVTMEACITSAKASGTEIFTDDLVDSIRFGWVPEVWELNFTGNPYHIKEFRPVFLDTTYFGCNASICDIMHTPGVTDSGVACPSTPMETRITCGTPGSHNKSLEAVTSWILSQSIVPPNAKVPGPGAANQRSFNLTE